MKRSYFLFSFFLGILLVCIQYPKEIVNYNITYISLEKQRQEPSPTILLKSEEFIKHAFVMVYAIIMYYLPSFVIIMLTIILCNFSFQNDFWQIMLVISLISYLMSLKKLIKKISNKKVVYSFFYFSLGYFSTTMYWLLFSFFDKTNNMLL